MRGGPVHRYRDEVYVAGTRLTGDEDARRCRDRRVVSTRERTPDEWWERAGEVVSAGLTPGWHGFGIDFLDYFIGGTHDLAPVPDAVGDEVADAMLEAAREAATDVLVEFSRRLIPVIHAIEGLR